jgi:hypothetical protein
MAVCGRCRKRSLGRKRVWVANARVNLARRVNQGVQMMLAQIAFPFP